MTPGARVAAAIEILDQIDAGQPAEQALTRWARASRFAGSKDRAAVRDHVFDVLRHWRSDAVRGGGQTGRARMIGRLRGQEMDPDTLFTGDGHAPARLSDAERGAGAPPTSIGDRWDLPEWLVPQFEQSLGQDAARTALALTARAPVTLRVNLVKSTREGAREALARDGIHTVENPRAHTALTVREGARRVRNAQPYLSGEVDIQDAASQAAVAAHMGPGRALDLCAGGGGKALALAAQGWSVTASDIDADRMRDLPARAARGGHKIRVCPTEALSDAGAYDLVFVDAPCSGSGTWRRAPHAKWVLSPDQLAALVATQRDILASAARHVAPGGTLAYATCSVLQCENEAQVAAFLEAQPGFAKAHEQKWSVDDWGDGFFTAHLTREV
ncbi:MAG: RsmB/NOP family class I SAM-dependent RNA methyltransferase [Pseudomonadota bacterium]